MNIASFVPFRSDNLAHIEVSQQDVQEFERHYGVPVLCLQNVPDYHQRELPSQVNDVAPVLNALCEYLWHRDQILAGVVNPTQNDAPSAQNRGHYF